MYAMSLTDELHEKLRALDAEFDQELRARGFDPAPPADERSEAAWDQAKAALDRGHQALVEAIANVAESRLDEPIFEGMSTVYVTLHGVIQHDLYHAGQIAMLKKAL